MRRIAVTTTAVIAVLTVVGLVAGGWFYSNEILAVPAVNDDPYTLTITAVDAASETVTFDVQNSEAVTLPVVGLRTERGSIKLSGTPRFLESETERRATLVSGQWPKAGDLAAISVNIFDGDPHETLGMPFDTVLIDGELGPMPAWQVIPDNSDSSTWVVLVHGRGADRPSNNRYLSVMHELGLPTLSITLRNDPQSPPDPSGYGRFGFAEWRDLEAAINHLIVDEDADHFILVGSSQGASVSLMFLRNSQHAARVSGVILISPLISLDATLRLAAADRGINRPFIGPLVQSAKLVTRLRSGIVFSALEHHKHISDYPADLPFLITHGDRDATVPFEPTPRFAAALGRRAVFVPYPGTGHVREWSMDRERFEADIRQFINGDILDGAIPKAG